MATSAAAKAFRAGGVRLTARLAEKIGGGDALAGTQHALLPKGRELLACAFREAAQGAQAVCTGLDATMAALNRVEFFEDFTRANDLTHLGVATPDPTRRNMPDKADLSLSVGQSFVIPRLMASPGEKVAFAGILQRAIIRCAFEGVADLDPKPLVGATIKMEIGEDPVNPILSPATRGLLLHHDGGSFGDQIVAAAMGPQIPDFFAVEGVKSAADVAALAAVWDANKPRMARLKRANSVGYMVEMDEDTELGFDIPAVLVAPAAVAFDEIVAAAAEVPLIVGVVPDGQAEVVALPA